MIRPLLLLALLAVVLPGALLAAEVSGRVATRDGLALPQVRVEDLASGAATFTDADGRFTLDCDLPCDLSFVQPRFGLRVVTVTADTASAVAVVLVPKQEVFDEVDVTATRTPSGAFIPPSVASTAVSADEQVSPPATLTELVTDVAGVAENGQGGVFQVFSIRGVSRHRVQTMISGMRLAAERRAGVASSFVEPLLLGSVDVLRGPASTYYGSGALGGVVQAFPRRFAGPAVETGWSSVGDERYLVAGWGDEAWSVGLAARDAGNAETPDGRELDSHFTQYSAVVERRFAGEERDWKVLVLPAYGDDLGKSSARFPTRPTEYPRERHLLVKVDVADRDGWAADLWIHPNDVVTSTLRPGERTEDVFNEAFDFGGSWQRETTGALRARYGVDLFSRRGVDADEVETRFSDGRVTVVETLDQAELDELAGFGSLAWEWGPATLQAGARWTWEQQRNAGGPWSDDSALTGFLGAVVPLAGGFEATANVGSGLRFPSLSERFFSGATGRGDVVGNPDLEAESSLSTDLGLRWFADRTFLAVQAFRLEIDDYIERVELAPDVLGYVNLESGTITGLEVEGFHRPVERWLVAWSGTLLDGEAESGAALADVPAARVQVEGRFRQGPWEARLRYQHRFDKDDPGPSEVAIGGVDLVSASLSYALRGDLRLHLRGTNLLDETYFNSADDLAALSPGRGVGLGVEWAP